MAENYTDGKGQYDKSLVGDGYTPSYTEIVTGTGENVYNAPNTGGGGKNNRHCAAWENTNPAFIATCEALKKLEEAINQINSLNALTRVDIDPEIAIIKSQSTRSKMPKNTGE